MDIIYFHPSPTDNRDFLATIDYQQSLPLHVDLLPDVEEVENQYQSGSCTANAAASALEIAYKRANQSKDFSRLYNYWYSRALGNISGDSGAYPRDVCKALQKYGICLESTWEFNLEKNLNVEPNQLAQDEAKQYPIYEYAKLYSNDVITEIKKAVASGIPVMTSIKVSKEFYSLGPDWKQHDWDHNKDFVGAHQVLIIGYNDANQRFLAQNSWGNRWGDGGFFGIPYNKIGLDYYDINKSAYEYWILTRINVPYINADGKENEPINVIEQEELKRKIKERNITYGTILIIVLIIVFQLFQLNIL